MVAKTEEKDKKTGLGSKILDYVPWRTALTAAAFAIPVASPIFGTVVGVLAYGNYRKNNRTEESSKEGAKPGRLKKLSSQAGTIAKRIGVIAIGFLLGGPVGGIIAISLMIIDGVSGGKLIQGAEKILDVGYDILSAVGEGISDVGKMAFSKAKGVLSKRGAEAEKSIEEKDDLMHGYNNPVYLPDIEVDKSTQNVGQKPPASKKDDGEKTTITAGRKVEGKKSRNILEERKNSGKQDQGFVKS